MNWWLFFYCLAFAVTTYLLIQDARKTEDVDISGLLAILTLGVFWPICLIYFFVNFLYKLGLPNLVVFKRYDR